MTYDSDSDDSDRWDCDDYNRQKIVVTETRTADLTTFKTVIIIIKQLIILKYIHI